MLRCSSLTLAGQVASHTDAWTSMFMMLLAMKLLELLILQALMLCRMQLSASAVLELCVHA